MKCTADRRWCRFWSIYAATALGVGVVMDTVAYVRGGWPATLTAHIQRWFGIRPQTRYARLGQASIVLFLTWASVHLTFGILGPTRGRERA